LICINAFYWRCVWEIHSVVRHCLLSLWIKKNNNNVIDHWWWFPLSRVVFRSHRKWQLSIDGRRTNSSLDLSSGSWFSSICVVDYINM
jgi:hypothetical protein